MTRHFFLLPFLSVCSIYVLSSAHEPADRLRHKNIGEKVLYANPHATMPDSGYQNVYLPIVADWQEEVYVSDSTRSFCNPRIGISDSLQHVFSERSDFAPIHFTSDDGGSSWQLFADYTDTANSVPPGVMNVFCENSGIYSVWLGGHSEDDLVAYFRSSSDCGRTWPITARLRYWQLFTYLRYGNVAGHGDTAFVSFCQDPHILACWRSADRGLHWTDPGAIASQNASYEPSIVYQGGVVSIVYNAYFGISLDVYFISSFDHGVTWNPPELLGFPDEDLGQWPELAADSLGNVAVCWVDGLGTPYAWTGGIWCRVSHDSGQTWNEAVRLDSDYLGNVGTSVAIDGDYVSVVWTSPGYLHYRESWDGGANWRADQIVSQGACWDPRLVKRYDTVHLIWSEIEYINPQEDRRFIKYARNDGVNDIESEWNSISRPVGHRLASCPNPFNSSTLLTLTGWEGGDAKIQIYDVRGSLTRNLSTKGGKATWDATDNTGRKVSSGIYFARVETPQGAAIARLMHLK